MNGCGSMAKISMEGLYQYEKLLAELGQDVEKMAKYAVYPAAGMVLDELKAATPRDTGDLANSEILTKFQTTEGAVYTAVVFDGYDRKGTPNSLKARAIESGTSRLPKRPFIRPTVTRIKRQVIDTIANGTDEYISKVMEGKSNG